MQQGEEKKRKKLNSTAVLNKWIINVVETGLISNGDKYVLTTTTTTHVLRSYISN